VIGYIVVAIVLWALKFTPKKQSSREVRIFSALANPLIALGYAFLWNSWARHLIGWPEIKTFQEFVLAILIF